MTDWCAASRGGDRGAAGRGGWLQARPGRAAPHCRPPPRRRRWPAVSSSPSGLFFMSESHAARPPESGERSRSISSSPVSELGLLSLYLFFYFVLYSHPWGSVRFYFVLWLIIQYGIVYLCCSNFPAFIRGLSRRCIFLW